MNWKEFAEKYLEEFGMFPDTAREIVKVAQEDPILQSMENRWLDRVEDYPEAMKQVLSMSVRSIALEWIEANLPKAWFKDLLRG